MTEPIRPRRRAPPEVPAATYRLQVHAGFRLEDAAEVAGYLADLGVTHAYSSPLLRSAEGSNHGYDTVDHAHIDEARGGRPASTGSSPRCTSGLGLVLDLVPNHMGVADAAAAPWWWDVLQHGRDSARGRVRHRLGVRRRQGAPPGARLGGRRRKLKVVASGTSELLHYYDNRFPIAPGTESGTRRRCTPASTTSSSTGGARTPTSTTAGSSRSTPSPDCASRTRRSSTRPTRSSCSWCRRCGRRPADRPPRAWRTRRLPRAAGRGVRRPVDGRREDPRARRGPPGVLADRGDDGATTRSPRSTRCWSTPPARRRSPRWTPSSPAGVDYGSSCTTASARSPTACSGPRSPAWSG